MNIDKSLFIPSNNHLVLPDAARKTQPLLKIGAILDVLVANRQGQNSYQLQWGQQRLSAVSHQPLAVGSRQLLRVTGTDKHGQWQTEPLPPRQNDITQALRQRLPEQLPLAHLLPKAGNAAAKTQPLLVPLLASASKRSEVTRPEGLKDAISRSGLFLEAKLASAIQHQRPLPPRDLKSVLLQILHTARSMPQATSDGAPGPANTAANANTVPGQPTGTRISPSAYLPTLAKPSDGSLSGQNDLRTQGGAVSNTASPTKTSAETTPAPPSTLSRALSNTLTSPIQNDSSGRYMPAKTFPPATAPATTSSRGFEQLYQAVAQQLPTMQALGIGNTLPALTEIDWESPAQITRVLEGAVSRIESQQLASLQARELNQSMLLFELPVNNREHVDCWQGFLREDQSGRSDAQGHEETTHWLVSLSVNLPDIGELSVHIDYSEQETAITYYSSNPDVLGMIEKRADELASRLIELGVINTDVAATFGALPEKFQPDIATTELNEHA